MTQDDRLKPHRPPNTSLRQQRMKAWQPLITPKSVLPTLFIIGFIFAPLGAFLLRIAWGVSELVIDYTDCMKETKTNVIIPKQFISYSAGSSIEKNSSKFTWSYDSQATSFSGLSKDEKIGVCTISLQIPSTFEKPVFFYYRLTNFYQNHRQYVKSFNAAQLAGEDVTKADIKSSCDSWGVKEGSEKIYYPCGLIASSIFNDSFSKLLFASNVNKINEQFETNYEQVDASVEKTVYEFTDIGIEWPSDGEKYKLLKKFDPKIHIPPVSWQKRYGESYINDLNQDSSAPNVILNPRFWVWMRTAGLPTFRKLWGRNTNMDLEVGVWLIKIENNFPVDSYQGRKSFVISTTSFLGGRNMFLGYAYITVGCFCIIFGVVFTIRHLVKPRKIGDHSYLSWNQQPPAPSNGVASSSVRPEETPQPKPKPKIPINQGSSTD